MKLLRTLVNLVSVAAIGIAAILLLALTVAPAAFGYKTYVVLSGSMEPSIQTGAVIFATPVPPASLQVGDVIVYNRSDVNETVTHRILEKRDDGSGKPTFITKGDANSAPDAWTVQYPGNTAGKVALAIPYVGYVTHALGGPQGRLALLVVPVVTLTIMWLVQIWRPASALASSPVAPAVARTDSDDELPPLPLKP